MAETQHYNVLFLCTGNSARSIMAEAILNARGKPRFTAYSAGSHPSGVVRPEAIRLLDGEHIPTAGLRSKSWDEFARDSAPRIDVVITVCDNAAKEACPLFSQSSKIAKGGAGAGASAAKVIRAHWGVPDPAAVKGTSADVERAFQDAFQILERRIEMLLALAIESMGNDAVEMRLLEIGRR